MNNTEIKPSHEPAPALARSRPPVKPSPEVVEDLHKRARDVVRAFIGLGHTLNTFCKDYPPLRFTFKFKEHGIWIDQATASTAMIIADNSFIADPRNAALLPPSPEILRVLAAIDPDRIKEGLNCGVVHPEMTKKAAMQFWRRCG